MENLVSLRQIEEDHEIQHYEKLDELIVEQYLEGGEESYQDEYELKLEEEAQKSSFVPGAWKSQIAGPNYTQMKPQSIFNPNDLINQQYVQKRNNIYSYMNDHFNIGYENKKVSFPESWRRPFMPPVNITKDTSVLFQQTDTTHSFTGNHQKAIPVLEFWGVTKEGNTILAKVSDFNPYLWVKVDLNYNKQESLKSALNTYIHEELRKKNKGKGAHFFSRDEYTKDYIVSMELHRDKKDIQRFNKELDAKVNPKKEAFIKISFHVPGIIPIARRLLEKGIVVGKLESDKRMDKMHDDLPGGYMCYEAKLPYVIRAMVDKKMGGFQWIRATNIKPTQTKNSTCQFEFDVSIKDLHPVPLQDLPCQIEHPKGEQCGCEFRREFIDENAPIRIFSFDIEVCHDPDVGFRVSGEDPICEIAGCLGIEGEVDGVQHRVGFQLDGCDPIEGAEVYTFKKEEDLLIAFADYIHHVDPDIMIGYNSDDFDFQFIFNRAKKLGISNIVHKITRMNKDKMRMETVNMTSKAYGQVKYQKPNIKGRFSIDVMRYLHREYKLRSYSLNAVSEEFLGDSKMDMDYDQIPVLQHGSNKDRKRLMEYCLKDAELPLKLYRHLMIGLNYISMSRVTGVPMSMLLSRGTQIKVMALFTKMANERGYLLPSYLIKPKGSYPGAFVLDPEVGFHKLPVTTLDFASLYPSIMMAENLCYTTLIYLKDAKAQGLTEEDYNVVPYNPEFVFVKPHIKKGVLPELERFLYAERKKAKLDLKLAKKRGDKAKTAIFNARQLAIKLVMNSAYGFTASQMLPCVEIARAITGFGRWMIMKTKEVVESHFTKANGYKHDAKVIYGDTGPKNH